MIRLLVFASGRGSNARNIFALAKQYPRQIEVVGLVTENPKSGVLQYAKTEQIPIMIVPLPTDVSGSSRRREHEWQILKAIKHLEFDYICLAGYMRILTPEFLAHFPHPNWSVSKIINIHPSLLPSFRGVNAYQQAFRAGVKVAGVSLHFVDAGVDTGSIIHQRTFPRLANDTLESFMQRGLQQEYIAYREVLMALSMGTYTVVDEPFALYIQMAGEE